MSPTRVSTTGSSPRVRRSELGRPYVLTVATLEPRKNLATLLDAYSRLGSTELALAVAGAAGWGNQASLDVPGVLRLGYTPHDDLPELYRGASVLVYPSLFEGFGMPVVEAMACGVPCVVSSHTSLDEACGDAAIRVDPRDADAIADGIDARDRQARRARRVRSLARTSIHVGSQRASAPRGLEGCAMKVAVDVTPLAQTRAGTARYLHALLPRIERDVQVDRVSGYARGRPGPCGSISRGTPTSFRIARALPTFCTARRIADRCTRRHRSW